MERVEFVTGSAKRDEVSYELLDEVATLLLMHAELKLMEVEGHTDNAGNANLNRQLSTRRARSVESYLIGKGVGRERLITSGHGPDLPIASNDTAEGRAKNRRVEFHIRRRAQP